MGVLFFSNLLFMEDEVYIGEYLISSVRLCGVEFCLLELGEVMGVVVD